MGISLTQPSIGSTTWGSAVNANFAAIQNARAVKNALINPRFLFWQRGTAFSDTGYTADRWKFSLGGTASVSRQTFSLGASTNPPYEPQYYLRISQTAAGASVLEQRIEGVRTFAGQYVTVSFWAYFSTGAAATVTPELVQNFGTGGTPSAAVTTAFSAQSVGTTA